MYLDVDPETAADLKRLELDCSKDVAAGGAMEHSGPLVLFVTKFDRDCYVAGARAILGDELVDRLLGLDPRAELRIVDERPRHAELRAS